MSDQPQEKGPRYLKVKEHIMARIASGEFGPGSRVPSENELVSRFGLSRKAFKRAVGRLLRQRAVIVDREGYLVAMREA